MDFETVDELRKYFIDKYITYGMKEEIESALNIEYERKTDYNGRQIFELLQNVDDAISSINKKDSKVEITFKNNILEVRNTGTEFSSESIRRLCLGGASGKTSDDIGNKGTGFRSLLNDSEWIELYSGKYAIRFSEKYTNKIFDSYRDVPIIKEEIKKWEQKRRLYPLCFPVMNCPEDISQDNPIFKNLESNNTLIRVKIKDENFTKGSISIEEQLKYPFYRSLLFLPKISQIIINTDEGKKVFSKEGDKEVTLYTPSGNQVFYIYKKTADIELLNNNIKTTKKAKLTLAVSTDPDFDYREQKLFCYFEIRNFNTPLHVIISATFNTNSTRDDLNNDQEQINIQIFRALIDFIKESAEDLAKRGHSELAVKMITPISERADNYWSNKLFTAPFNLKNEYISVIKKAKIFKTVNGDLISLTEGNPKIIEEGFPEEFKGDAFKDLLISYGTELNKFIKTLSLEASDYKTTTFYSTQSLAEKIETIVPNLDVSARVKIYLWWSKIKKYKDSSLMPALLLDSNNELITKDKTVYLPTDGGVSELPPELSWVKLSILRTEYVDEIIKQIKESDLENWTRIRNGNPGDKRTLAEYSRIYLASSFIEQSASAQMVSVINSQVGEDPEKAIIFFRWFYNGGKGRGEGNVLHSLSYKLPTKDNKVTPLSQLYFGEEYDNPLAAKLFLDTDYSPIAALDTLYDGEDKENFIKFLKEYGVLKYPKVLNKVDVSYNHECLNYVNATYGEQHAKLYSNTPIIKIILTDTVKNYEKLISTLSTEDIKEWLLVDSDLRDSLISNSNTTVLANQLSHDRLKIEKNFYIKFILNTTPWVELGGKKYAPNKIIMYEKLKDKLPGYYGVSEVELINLLGREVVYDYKLDFKESMGHLEDKEIYSILKILPGSDNGEISRKLYLDLIKCKKDKTPSYKTEGIEVLAKDGKFYLNNKVQYADRKVSKSEESRNNFIYIQPKQSTKTVERWLGVKPYASDFELIENGIEPLSNDNDFYAEYNEIRIAVLCMIDHNQTNIANIKKNVKPCKLIKVKDVRQNNKVIQLEDYFYIESRGTFYIKIPDGISRDDLRKSTGFAVAIVDLFRQMLTLELDSNLLELLVSKELNDKISKIVDEFGIDAWKNAENSIGDYRQTGKLVHDFFRRNGLDEDLLKKIDSSDLYTDHDLLIECLRSISKDIKDLNETSEILHFSLLKHYADILRLEMNKHEDLYKTVLYKKCKVGSLEEREKFLSTLYAYSDFDTKKIFVEDSVYVNIDEVLIKAYPEIQNKNCELIDIDAIYTANATKIIEEMKISADDFDFYIQNHKKHKSVLYFEIPADIKDNIEKFCKKNKPDDNTPETSVTLNPDETSTRVTEITKVEWEPSLGSNSRGEKSQSDFEHKNASSERKGKKAEEIAYVELKKTYPELIWHSKNSTIVADRNKLPPKGIVCDMWVKNDSNIYFEVKSSIDSFEMSINEYMSMESNPSNFYVVLVDVEKKSISYHRYDEIKDCKHVSGYTFRFKQIDKN